MAANRKKWGRCKPTTGSMTSPDVRIVSPTFGKPNFYSGNERKATPTCENGEIKPIAK